MRFLPTNDAPAPHPRTELPRRYDTATDDRRGAPSPAGERPDGEWSPVADIHETDTALTFTVELPGIAPGRVSVTAENNVVTIDGARSSGHLGRTDGSYHLRERHNGPFVRRFRLPAGVDAGAIRSDYADGILTVHVPKAGLAARVVCTVTTAPDRTSRATGVPPRVELGVTPREPARSDDTHDSTGPAGAAG
jgi:HSP20 family protein